MDTEELVALDPHALKTAGGPERLPPESRGQSQLSWTAALDKDASQALVTVLLIAGRLLWCPVSIRKR